MGRHRADGKSIWVKLNQIERITGPFPLGYNETVSDALEKLLQDYENLKAGMEAGSRLETSLQSSVTSKLEPASPVTESVTESATKSVTYDWTQVPECPLRQEDRNLCIWKAPRKKAIIEEIEPEICKRCEFVLRLNEKIKQIELEAIEKRAQIERDRLERERLKAKEEEEKTRRKQMTQERGPPTVYFPDGEVWR